MGLSRGEPLWKRPMNLIIRPATDEDRPFIYQTWLRTFKHSAIPRIQCDGRIYFEGQTKLIASLLLRSNVLVACDPEYPSVVYGYCVQEGRTLHWVYVKRVFRRFGVARALLFTSGLFQCSEYSHKTKDAQYVVGSAVYNPYAVMNEER